MGMRLFGAAGARGRGRHLVRAALANRPSRRPVGVLTGVVVAAVASAGLTSCGSPAAGAVSLSVSSAPVGTEIHLKGNAGSGCVVDKNWLGFDFERVGDLSKGPMTQMTTPILANGAWSATFVVPPYLGGSASRGPGALTTAGRYQVVAPDCEGHKYAEAMFRVTSEVASGSSKDYVAMAATLDGQGYWLLQAGGQVTVYGDATSYGSLAAAQLPSGVRAVGFAHTYDAHGYWVAASNGHVYNLGDARAYGSLAVAAAKAPVTGIAATPDGKGYWLLAADGHVYNFGDASRDGMPNSYLAPYDAIATRPAGGYVVTSAADGAVFVYPGGTLSSGGPGAALSAMLVGVASTPSGNGTWQAGLDGGVLTSGDANSDYYGSVPGENAVLKAPVVAIAATPDGKGYWLLGRDGTVFNFGDAHLFALT